MGQCNLAPTINKKIMGNLTSTLNHEDLMNLCKNVYV